MNLWHLYIYDCDNFVLFCVYTCQSCVLNMCTCAYIYSALVLVSDIPTVEINILWDGAACCFQIARIFILFAALYRWNIQFAAASDVCHCDYSPLFRVLYVSL